MSFLPDFIGPAAFGIRMGVVRPGSDLKNMIKEKILTCQEQNLLSPGDILCITESVVAKGENNYVPLKTITEQVKDLLELKEEDKLGVVFPITSRNRFSMILQALSRTVPKGEVIVQLSFPTDEVGNQIIHEDTLKVLGRGIQDILDDKELQEYPYQHPITGVNYVRYYKELIEAEGPEAKIILANNPEDILKYNPKGIIAADIHQRGKTLATLKKLQKNTITLQDICNKGPVSSPFGLLGSNLSCNDMLKLAPRDGDTFVQDLQEELLEATGIKFHIIIYGDGAYKDPITGIYELADPQTFFGLTKELEGLYRQGIKYKFMADKMSAEGKENHEIEAFLKEQKKVEKKDDFNAEGTTPRRLVDILASLADLLSGSADAGTPLILIKNFQ